MKTQMYWNTLKSQCLRSPTKKKKIVICKHLGKIRIDLNKAVKSPHAVYKELFVKTKNS